MKASLRRSMLFVPGNDPALLKDAHIYGADSLIFDLEDSVSPAEKDAARLLVYSALRSVDYGRAERVVRINGLDTPWARQDVAAMVRAGVQIIRLPKTESPADIAQLEAMITRAELDCGRASGSVGVLAALESPSGVLNARDIARSSPRLVGIAL
ncbi:MAG: aldolase/citrate lyase family protein, partial [Spirochaetaceae bacterium]|nr:aldolase/citrate lyase family protein [Spirochaetaceae bacterium]